MTDTHTDDTLDDIWSPLTVGDVVPEEIGFEVYHEDRIRQMSFKDLRGGWTILFFYPADFTFVCPTELGEMADLYETFKKDGAEIVSVSTDTVHVHKAWHDTSAMVKKVSFPMAADPAHELSDLFGVLIAEKGITHRGTFIISPEGVIKTLEVNDDAVGRSGKETLRKFRAAKHALDNPGTVCPASWEEGGETLTPGLDLVGKL
ncbi:redoxin domain-containing protein [Candidatus Kaiserbacteria bacterium]|nr:redoxin domain-containing protein [Candidatus Kaiserbacteria bacterium]